MQSVIQKTKLYPPPARASAVVRPRLLAKLDSLLEEGRQAAVFSAPAGFGKTTLIVQWLAHHDLSAGWLSLDERDNLPARFFSYLIASLQHIAPGAGREAGSLLELPGANVEEIITLLTNDLASQPRLFVLVLDDFHTITNPLLQQALDLLIEAQPPQMRLVLLSREDPGIQMARRRARGQFVEIRQADLAFTLEEARAFLNQGMGLELTTDQIEILDMRTEGWIAGLQMASLALQSPPAAQAPVENEKPIAFDQTDHTQRFLHNFSGRHHFILDYLMEEVLALQPQAVQSFLLDTSILDRMHADLCSAITGMTLAESQKMLEQITRANLFVIPLDGERRWYRYHHLFGDLLLARLQSEHAAHARELFLRASNWFESNGDPRLAVEYALKAQDFHRAADLLDLHMTERWQTVDMEFFKLVNRLPFEKIAERPSLCLQSAWLCVLFGQTDRILPFVDAAERALDESSRLPGAGVDQNSAANRAFARTLRAYVADIRNQSVELDQSLEMAHAAIPETNPGMRNSVGVVVGMICFMEGDFAAAMRYYEDALALDMRANGTNAVPIAVTRICFVLQAQGKLREAMRRLQAAEDYVRQRGIRRFYISGSLYHRMAEILLEWNRLDEAEDRLREGTRLLQDWPMPTTQGLGLALLIRLRTARGDLVGARQALAMADSKARQTGLHPYFLDALERARVRLLLAEHNHAALEQWVAENDPYRQRPLSFRFEARQVELSQAWLAIGRVEEATGLLDRLAQDAQDRNGSRINILVLLASARHQHPEKALLHLEEALRLAEPEGYLRTFLEAGDPLFHLLRLWLQRGPSKDDIRLRAYAQAVLSAWDGPGKPVFAPSGQQTVEPLSRRELEVLSLLAKGLSNQQIADRLVISVRTVKKHVENIHGKLGVQSRTQAVARARELGLVE